MVKEITKKQTHRKDGKRGNEFTNNELDKKHFHILTTFTESYLYFNVF